MEELRKVSIQFMRYFGVALIGYIFDFGILILLHELLHVHYLIAGTCGFVIGLIIVYVLSSKYVFGESKIKSKSAEFGLFAIVGLVGLGILNVLMWIFTDFFLVNYIVSKIIATTFVYTWNFFARRSLYHDQIAN